MGVLMDAFTLKQLQDSRALLQYFVSNGVTDVERAGLLLDKEIAMRISGMAKPVVHNGNSTVTKSHTLCPSCGRAYMVPPKGTDEPILVCPACRYSIYERVGR